MSRPKSKKKGRTLPMSSQNGNSVPGIPPDIEWNEDNPPVIYECSQHVEHHPACGGDCDGEVASEATVKLLNEARAWARIPMSFHGVPTCFPDGAFDGVKVNIFDEKLRNMALQKVLIDAGLTTQEEVDEIYLELKFDTLYNIRTEYQEAVKRQKMQETLALPDKRLYGPNGQIL
jgi:hypothetical protein